MSPDPFARPDTPADSHTTAGDGGNPTAATDSNFVAGTALGTANGNQAIADAEERAKATAGHNIPFLPDLGCPADTANLRQGMDLNPGLLALLPLVGVWRGEGEGRDPESDTDYHFAQQLVVSHDGGPYLLWESRTWVVDDAGAFVENDLRESGFWRVSTDPADGDEVLELLLTHSSGVVELYYGRALTQSSWELATDVVIRSQSGAVVGGAKRLYGIVDGGDLGYVEERVLADGPMAPHISARLSRYIG